MGKEEIKSRLFESFDNKEFEALLTSYINSGMLVVKNNMIMQTGTGVIERIEKEPEVLTLVKVLLKEELQLLKLEQLSCIINVEPDTCGDIIRFLIFTEKITDLGDGQFIHNVVLKNSVRKVMKIIDEKGVTTAAEVRDLLDTGRKNAIVVMEYLDSMGITLRVGDIRKQGPNYSHFRM